jgi:6-pyruvoyltetrahydropterin/6-carboxytetrahydropterin synthase
MNNKSSKIEKQKILELLSKKMTMQEMAKELSCNVSTIIKWMKRYEIKPLGSSYFNKGINNAAKRKEVREKISKSVKGLWDNGVYKDRINGMMYKFDWEHPNYSPKWSYRDYVKMYQPLVCYYCGATEQERKIDIHHLDEDRENWLLSNLLPVCNVCHQFFHFKRYKGPMLRVGKIFRFESSHHLFNYIGACERPHGHSYELEIIVRGQINRDTGMVIDYKNLKDIVQKYVIDVFDHHDSSDFMDCNSTAENMGLFIWEKLEKEGLVKGLDQIFLKETATSTLTVTKQDMLEYYTLNKEYIIRERK